MLVQYLKRPAICNEASKEELCVPRDVNPSETLQLRCVDIVDFKTISVYYHDFDENNYRIKMLYHPI